MKQITISRLEAELIVVILKKTEPPLELQKRLFELISKIEKELED